MANNERVQINLDFKVNTQQAQQSMNQLQMNLSKIAMEGSSIKVDSASLNQASEAAKKLSIHLNNAYNASTGKLDLSKFHKSLKQGQDSVKSLSTELLKAGSTGQQAFVQLSQSIAQAERPVITISNRLSKLGETLKNTVRWQISTSILQDFTGAIQKAYSYTKDLNKNLNDIRIVTGYSADRMADFAKEANKAAKALSSSTNEYAKASLIYFQQGLSDQEVKERTDATIKMANVTGQAAQEVSDQMTAIWNNFDNGSKSLEYYADVITALGAATASSSEEISEGLNKFAAVAETVGLSYEYAASALATVTATTRQSADVVGTAFKTLFARIQDLELGNTLDDGTTLGQYSDALAKVGINIKDSSGQMKDMNNILDEMGSKWNTLSKDTQVAVAQSVAGVRQYTQLIALMDNWDFFQQNLSTATGAEGTLNKQFAIYEQSWEAASKRMQASAEALYDKLLDDEFFIKLTDGLGSFLDSIGAIIDGLGGMKGVLISVSGILTQMFAGKIQQGMQNLAHNFSIMMGGAAKAHAEITQQMTSANAAAMSNPNLSDESKQQLTSANQLMAMKERMGVLGDSLSEAEKQRYEQEIQIIETHQKENLALQQKLTSQKAIVAEIEKELELLKEEPMEESDLGGDAETLRKIAGQEKTKAIKAGQGPGGTEYNQAQAQLKHFETLDSTRQSFTKTLMDRYDEAQFDPKLKGTPKNITYDFVRAGKENGVQSIKDNFTITGEGYAKGGAFDFMRSDTKQKTPDVSAAKAALEQLQKDMEAITSGAAPELKAAIDSALEAKTGASLKKRIEEVKKALTQVKIEGQNVGKVLKTNLGQEKHITKVTKKVKELNKEQQKTTEIQKDLEKNTEKINKAVKNFNPQHIMGGTEAFLKLTGAASGAVMGVQQLINLVDVWNNQDLSIGEKITSTIMALTMGVPMILQAVGSMKQFGQAVTAARAAQALLTQAINDENVASALSLALSEKEAGAISEETMKKLQQTLVEKGLATETNKQAMANEFLAKTKLKATAAGKAKAAGDVVEATTSKVVEEATESQTGAVVANTAAWYTNPITAIIAVALLAVAGAVLAVTSGMKANSEAIQENSKKATEKVEKTREEVKVNGDLVDSYLTLYNTYKTTGEGKEELYNASQDLVDIYGIEGGAIAALTGDYDGLTKAILKARQAEIQKQINDEKSAQIAQTAAVVDAGTKGSGHTAGTGGRLKGELNNDVAWSQFDPGDDEFGVDAVLKQGNYKYLKLSDGGDISYDIDSTDVNQVYGLYNEMRRFAQELEARGVSSGSDIYQDVLEEIKDTEESFLALQQSVQSQRGLEKEQSLLSTTFSGGKTIADISSYEDYNSFYKQYKENYENLLKKQGIVEDSDEWLAEMDSLTDSLLSNEITGKYQQRLNAINELNINKDDVDIQEYLKNISDKDLELLWTIYVNEDMTKTELEKAVEEAQKLLDESKLRFGVEIGTTALEAFNKGDFDALQKILEENQEIFGINLESFLEKFSGDLEGARNFLKQYTQRVAFDAAYYKATVLDVPLKRQTLEDAENAKQLYEQYKDETNKEIRDKAIGDNQYKKYIEDAIEDYQDVLTLTTEKENLSVQKGNYEAVRGVEKNYFDLRGTDEGNRLDVYQGKLENGELELTASKNISFKSSSKPIQQAQVMAIDTILENTKFSKEIQQALKNYQTDLSKGADTTNSIETLDKLTGNRFSDQVLNKEYDVGAYTVTEDDSIDGEQEVLSEHTYVSNEKLEEAIEGTNGYIDNLMWVLDYGVQLTKKDEELQKAKEEWEKSELYITQTAIQEAEQSLKTLYRDNMQLMIQREQQIEQQGLDIELWNDLTAEILATNTALDAYSAGKVAEQIMRQAKGLEELTSKWDELTGVINSTTTSTLESQKALSQLTTTLETMLGLSSGSLSQVWVKNNLDQINFAMTNDSEGAQKKARKIMAQGILESGGFKDTQKTNHFIRLLENAEKGETLETTDSYLNNFLRGDGAQEGSLSTDEQVALLGLYGYATQVVTKNASSITKNEDGTYTVKDADTGDERVVNANDVQTIETKDENGNVSTKYEYYMIDPELTKKTDNEYSFYDLQHNLSQIDLKNDFESQTIALNNQLKETEKRLTNINKQADTLYGADRIKELRLYGETLKESISPEGLYDQLINEANKETINKFAVLQRAATKLGISETLSGLEDKDRIVEYYQNYINTLNEEEKFTDAELLTTQLNNYLTAYETSQEYMDEKAEKFREWQENNLAIITESLEYNIGNLDDSLTLIERKLERIQDDAYKAAEAFDLIFGTNFDGNSQNNENSKIGLIKDKLVEYETTIESYEKAYANNEISAEQFATKMKEMRDSIYESVDALYEEDEQMKEFYGTTLSNAQEEIEKYTNLIEHQNTVLDHYANLSKLIGKEVDYEWMGEILSGQTAVLGQLAKESQIAYNNLLDDVNAFEIQYNAAVSSGMSEEVVNRLKNQWLEAQQAAAEKQDEMLQDLAAWAEAEQALLENSLNKFRKEFENALTGGLGFDLLSSNMDKTQSLQEEYLTTTNKIYETNKLISNAQKEIDKTTNSVAKKKLADFQRQTEALGNQTKLSQFELNIQQAKYDLLLAEIALEEAQNAKSQVRLRRDSEGNFGYVYSADQQKITDAEEKFMDAENALYNIRLEGANDYVSKQVELNQRVYDEMKQLDEDYKNGVITSEEELQERKSALKDWYTEKSKQYSSLETTAIIDDQRIQQEAWTNSYRSIVFSTNQFSDDISSYIGKVNGAFTGWKDVVDQVKSATGGDLEQLRDKVGEITTNADNLSKALLGENLDGNGGVVGSLESVMDKCVNAVNYYTTTLFPKLEELAKDYDGIASSANKAALAVGKVATEQSGSEWQNTIRQALEYFDAGEMDDLRTLYENTLNYTDKLSWEDFLKYDKDSQRGFLESGTLLKPVGETPKVKKFTIKAGASVYPDYRVKENGPVPMSTGIYNDTDEKIYNADLIIHNKASNTKFVPIGNGLYVAEKDIDIVNPDSFDTGGYTGIWGPEGKWAMLHQKEIVLNAQDTENLLAAVDILRQIVSVIDIQSQYNQLANTLIPSVSSYNNNGIEQNVHIEASFPSVTDHNEIELALRNIVNEASQYINRK